MNDDADSVSFSLRSRGFVLLSLIISEPEQIETVPEVVSAEESSHRPYSESQSEDEIKQAAITRKDSYYRAGYAHEALLANVGKFTPKYDSNAAYPEAVDLGLSGPLGSSRNYKYYESSSSDEGYNVNNSMLPSNGIKPYRQASIKDYGDILPIHAIDIEGKHISFTG